MSSFSLSICLSALFLPSLMTDMTLDGRLFFFFFSCTKPVAATLRSMPIAGSGGDDDGRVQHGVRSQAPSHGSLPRNGADQDVHLLIDP